MLDDMSHLCVKLIPLYSVNMSPNQHRKMNKFSGRSGISLLRLRYNMEVRPKVNEPELDLT